MGHLFVPVPAALGDRSVTEPPSLPGLDAGGVSEVQRGFEQACSSADGRELHSHARRRPDRGGGGKNTCRGSQRSVVRTFAVGTRRRYVANSAEAVILPAVLCYHLSFPLGWRVHAWEMGDALKFCLHATSSPGRLMRGPSLRRFVLRL